MGVRGSAIIIMIFVGHVGYQRYGISIDILKARVFMMQGLIGATGDVKWAAYFQLSNQLNIGCHRTNIFVHNI